LKADPIVAAGYDELKNPQVTHTTSMAEQSASLLERGSAQGVKLGHSTNLDESVWLDDRPQPVWFTEIHRGRNDGSHVIKKGRRGRSSAVDSHN